MIVIRRLGVGPIAAGWVLVFAAGCESDAVARPTLVPSLVELEPALSCIDAASSQSGIRECLARHGVPRDYNPSNRPITAQDFKRGALVMWSALAGGGGVPLSSQHFASAIDYARCIEEATHGLGGLEGEPRTAIGAGQAEAQSACIATFSSPESIAKRYPDILNGTGNLPVEEAKAYVLARIFSGAAYHYVIETNGWVTEGMRPCIRYLDGRPPSASCAGEPTPRVSPPPR